MGRKRQYATAWGDGPVLPMKRLLKESKIQQHDVPESAKSGRLRFFTGPIQRLALNRKSTQELFGRIHPSLQENLLTLANRLSFL